MIVTGDRYEASRVPAHAVHSHEPVAGADPDVLRDWQPAIDRDVLWIVSLGDSFSSGEGSAHEMVTDPHWLDDEGCHRSRHGWPHRVARRMDAGHDVHFDFLACSGARLEDGLLQPFGGREPQLDRLERLIFHNGRVPDVVLMTGGGNDVGFAGIVEECLMGRINDACPGGSATSAANDALETLETRIYPRVDERLKELGIPADDVYLVVYPDPVFGMKRNVGGAAAALVGLDNLAADTWGDEKVLAACWLASGKDQFEWVHRNVVTDLQAIQLRLEDRFGWNVVDDHLEPFKKHTYCPREGVRGADSWWVGFGMSFIRQGDRMGTFHPNARGHEAIADAVFSNPQSRS